MGHRTKISIDSDPALVHSPVAKSLIRRIGGVKQVQLAGDGGAYFYGHVTPLVLVNAYSERWCPVYNVKTNALNTPVRQCRAVDIALHERPIQVGREVCSSCGGAHQCADHFEPCHGAVREFRRGAHAS